MVAIMEGDMSATGLDVFHRLDPHQIEEVRQAPPDDSVVRHEAHRVSIAANHVRRGEVSCKSTKR